MSFIDAGFTQAEKALEWANKWHQTVVLWTIVGGTFTIVLGVLANLVGIPGFNFVLATVALLAGIFFLTKPVIVLSVFGIGSLTGGLPNPKISDILTKGFAGLPDFELKKFLGAGWKAIEATAHQVAHVLFFLTVLFVVLGTFPISDPTLVLPALVILTGFGFWSALFAKGNVWYRRVTIAILLVSGSIIFFQMYDPKGKIERIEAAQEAYRAQLIDEALTPILRKAENGVKLTADEAQVLEKAKAREKERSVMNTANRFFTDGEQDVTIDSLNPVQICGLPSSARRFTIVGGEPLIVILMPDDTSPTGMTATRTNTTNDPMMGIAVKVGEKLVRNGGLTKFSKDCSTIQLIVPPDTKTKIAAGEFVLAPITIRVRFE